MSKETTGAASFLLFFKKQFWSFKLYEKQSLLNIPLWGCVLIQAFILSLIPEDTFLFSGPSHPLLSHESLPSWDPLPRFLKICAIKGRGWGPFCRRQGQLLTLPRLPYDYKGQTTVLREKMNVWLMQRSPGMGQLWLWLDSGVKPIPRACFWSSLCLPSSRLVLVLALFVESWQQKLYPQFPSDSYFSHETSEADIAWHLWSDWGQISASGGMQYVGLLTTSTQNMWPERNGISPIAI